MEKNGVVVLLKLWRPGRISSEIYCRFYECLLMTINNFSTMPRKTFVSLPIAPRLLVMSCRLCISVRVTALVNTINGTKTTTKKATPKISRIQLVKGNSVTKKYVNAAVIVEASRILADEAHTTETS